MPTGTKKVIGASESSITKHMAISGACCEAESNEAAPIKAHAVTESVGNISIHTRPSIPPDAPERMVISVTSALATKVSANTPSNIQILDWDSGKPAFITDPEGPLPP